MRSVLADIATFLEITAQPVRVSVRICQRDIAIRPDEIERRAEAGASASLRMRPAPPHQPSGTLAGKDAHAKLGMRPGAVLRVGHGPRHRRGHRGTSLVAVLAFGDLTDEAVPRRLRRSASHVDLRA